MVCEGITTLVMPIARWRRRFDALLAIKGIDVSVVGPVNLIHLKIIKDLYGQDFSKFEWLITGSGSGADSGANGTWAMSASTASTLQRLELEQIVNTIMQEAVTVHAHAHDTLINFIGGEFNGTLLASGGNLWSMTGSLTDSNCIGPDSICMYDSNCWGPDDSNCMNPAATIITNVAYRNNQHIGEVQAITPFDTAKTVVIQALGAVNATALLNTIQLRPFGQSIREAMPGDAYVRRSNSIWKLVRTGGGERSRGSAPLGGVTAELNATLEKVRTRTRIDRNDMQRYDPQRQELPATERFAMLKRIGEWLDVVIRKLPDLENGTGLALPSSFIEGFNGLTTSLNGEKSEVYSPPVWNTRLESYRRSLGVFADIINDYVTGLFSKLHATGRATLLAECGFLPSDVAVTGTGNGTGNAPAPPGLTPAALQAVANLLSQLAGIKGQLELAGFTGKDLLQEGRVLRYAFKTRRVRFNGKKQFLTMVKLKESGKQTTYVAHFVDNKNVLNPSLDTAWFNNLER